MNITKSEIAALKLSLMTEHNTATRGLTDEAIVKLAHDKGVLSQEQRRKYLGQELQEPEQAKPEKLDLLIERLCLEEGDIVECTHVWDEHPEAFSVGTLYIIGGTGSINGDDGHNYYGNGDGAGFKLHDQASQEEAPMKPRRTTTKTKPAEQAPMIPTASATQADLLQQLMATMAPRETANTTEARIIELINEHSPVKRIEVKTPSGSKVQIEQQTHACFERSLQHLQLGNQIFFYGRSGAGKSTTATHLAKALDTACYIQGAILAKFEALGSLTATGYNKSIIRRWLENEEGGLLCIDELDASCPRALVTLMSIFDDNGELTFPDGETFKRTEKHFLIVTANTTGAGASAQYMGRTRLDKATLNRFVMIEHDYDEQIENTLADKKTANYCRRFRDACSKKGFDGALITPRTIKQAGKVSASKMNHQDKKSMIADILRQGLTSKEYDAVVNVAGVY